MLAPDQASMAIVLDDVVPVRHLSKRDVRFLLLGDDGLFPHAGRGKQR